MTISKFYRRWADMKSRCNNPHIRMWHRYGGRGIKYCSRWEHYKNFEKDMLSSYKEGMSLDRIDSNKNYEPSNCRWVGRSQQSKNTSRIRWITYQDEKKNLSEWAKLLNIKRTTLIMRIDKYGWTIDEAFSRRAL